MTRSRGIRSPVRRFTEVERELVRLNYADVHTAALAHVLGRQVGQIHQLAQRMGLRKSRETIAAMARERFTLDHGGRATCFRPGNVPANKGLRRPGYAPGNMAKTQFQKGHRPHTWAPVGSYRVNSDGYLDRKVSDTGYPPRDWVAVHRLVWIEHRGAIPAGHVVCFKPGRRTTELVSITVDALECLSRAEILRRNSLHNLPRPLVQMIQLRGILNRSINRRSKPHG